MAFEVGQIFPSKVLLARLKLRMQVLGLNFGLMKNIWSFSPRAVHFLELAMASLSKEKKIFGALKDLVCALDVNVHLSYPDTDRLALNRPLIYERDSDAICDALRWDDEVRLEEIQRQMLWPMGGGDTDFYGYCAISLDRNGSIIKSVDGLGRREYYGRSTVLVGIAEYAITAASRRGDEALAAPRPVIDAWAKEQMELILLLPLTDYQRQLAGEHLSSLVDDIRPIFFVPTSAGAFNLERLIAEIQAQKLAILPIQEPDRSHQDGIKTFYTDLPNVGHELFLRLEDINFNEFSICPNWGHFSTQVNADRQISVVTEPKPFANCVTAIIQSLSNLGVKFTLNIHNDYPLGRYIGLDFSSPQSQNWRRI